MLQWFTIGQHCNSCVILILREPLEGFHFHLRRELCVNVAVEILRKILPQLQSHRNKNFQR